MAHAANVVQAGHELHESPTGIIQPGAPSHWRLRHQERGHGAFHDLKVKPPVWQLPADSTAKGIDT